VRFGTGIWGFGALVARSFSKRRLFIILIQKKYLIFHSFEREGGKEIKIKMEIIEDSRKD